MRVKCHLVPDQARVYPRVCGGAVHGAAIQSHWRVRRVYPRVCGGAWRITEYALTCAGPGLSPRVRGSLCQIFDKGAALFSI